MNQELTAEVAQLKSDIQSLENAKSDLENELKAGSAEKETAISKKLEIEKIKEVQD